MSYLALYRRYRPQKFSELVGQKPISTTLRNQVKNGSVAHAYLFCGTRGTGKTSTAHIFARAINCKKSVDGEACGECESCISAKSLSTDIIEIDAASNNGVAEIRDLREKVRFAPMESRYKVYIIDEVHMLSGAAFNALLKTLEEPPAHVVFILATTEAQKLPATVLSRCQRFDFHRISIDDIIMRLKDVLADVGAAFEEEALRSIAISAQGALRDALSIADQCISFCGKNVTNEQVLSILGSMDQSFLFDSAEALLNNDSAAALKLLDDVINNGRDLGVFCRDLASHFRALMLMKATNKKAQEILHCTSDLAKRYAEQSDRSSLEKILRCVSLLVEAETDMKRLDVPRILLELALIRICRPQDEDGLQMEDKIDLITERIAALEMRIESGQIVAREEIFAQETPKRKASEKKAAEGKNAAVADLDSAKTEGKSVAAADLDSAKAEGKSIAATDLDSAKTEGKNAVATDFDSAKTEGKSIAATDDDREKASAEKIFSTIQAKQPESIRQIFRLYEWECQMCGNILEIKAPKTCLPPLLKTLRTKETEFSESIEGEYPGIEIKFVSQLTAMDQKNEGKMQAESVKITDVENGADSGNEGSLGDKARELFGENSLIFE